MTHSPLRWFVLGIGVALAAAAVGASPVAAGDMKANMPDPKLVPARGRADADTLAALLPAGLGDFRLEGLDRPDMSRSRSPTALVVATYQHAAEHVTVVVDRRPGQGRIKSRDVSMQGPPDREGTVVTITLTNGVSFSARSNTVPANVLEKLLNAIDLSKAESLAPVARK